MEDKKTFIALVGKDGSNRRRISEMAVLEKGESSADGMWVIAFAEGVGERSSPGVVAMSTRDGQSRILCGADNCQGRWSPDGKLLYLRGGRTDSVSGVTLVIPLGPAGEPPDSTEAMLQETLKGTTPPRTVLIKERLVSPGPDPSTYAFVPR